MTKYRKMQKNASGIWNFLCMSNLKKNIKCTHITVNLLEENKLSHQRLEALKKLSWTFNIFYVAHKVLGTSYHIQMHCGFLGLTHDKEQF